MKHDLYATWSEAGGQKPSLTITVHKAGMDNAEVRAAGHKFATWLMDNMSAGYMEGMREALTGRRPLIDELMGYRDE